MLEPHFVLRACCRAGAERKQGTIESPNGPSAKGYGLDREALGPIAHRFAEPQPLPRGTAIHEAAHAAIGHGHGWKIRYMRLDHPAQVTFEDTSSATPLERIVQYLAAPSAEDALRRWTVTMATGDVRGYLARVQAFDFGNCDYCQAACAATQAVGINAPAFEAQAVFRKGEALAIDLVRRPNVWRAINALADALMTESTIEGERAHAILAEHIAFGSLREAT
jgi:hypothetical protein